MAKYNTLLRRYNSVNVRYRTNESDHSHCGAATFSGSRFDYRVCLVAEEEDVGVPPDDAPCSQWSLMTREGAPLPRRGHTAIWTGNRMIVWGGQTQFQTRPDLELVTIQAGRFTVPIAYRDKDGKLVFFWKYYEDGGIYDPLANSWDPIPTGGPLAGRSAHSMTWTGNTENPATKNLLLIWGGIGNYGYENVFGDGAIFNPQDKTWKKMSMLNAPSSRGWHGAVWTGTKLIVWGGGYGPFNSPPGSLSGAVFGDGGMYDPVTDTWTTIPVTPGATPGAPTRSPPPMIQPITVWTGAAMIVYGSAGGRMFNPGSGIWKFMRTFGRPNSPQLPPGFWTGSKMLLYAGAGMYSEPNDTNAIYDPIENEWAPTTKVGAPNIVSPTEPPQWGKHNHSVVWTGRELLVYGGPIYNCAAPSDYGALYYPGAKQQGLLDADPDKWTPLCLPTKNFMVPYHFEHSAVWTGSRMLVWGGQLSYAPLASLCKSPPPMEEINKQIADDPPGFTNRGVMYQPANVTPTVGESIVGEPTSWGPKALPDTLNLKLENVQNCSGLSGVTIPLVKSPPFNPESGENDTPIWKSVSPVTKACGPNPGMAGMPPGMMPPGMTMPDTDASGNIIEGWTASLPGIAGYFSSNTDHFQAFSCMIGVTLSESDAVSPCSSTGTGYHLMGSMYPPACPDLPRLTVDRIEVSSGSMMGCPCCPESSGMGQLKGVIEP